MIIESSIYIYEQMELFYIRATLPLLDTKGKQKA